MEKRKAKERQAKGHYNAPQYKGNPVVPIKTQLENDDPLNEVDRIFNAKPIVENIVPIKAQCN